MKISEFKGYDSSSSDDEILLWEVDYGDVENFKHIKFETAYNFQSMHMMIINDHN